MRKRIIDIEVLVTEYGTGLVHFLWHFEDGSTVRQADQGQTICNRDYYIGKEIQWLDDRTFVICN